MSNPVAKVYKAYKTLTINPLINSTLLGLGAWWLAKKSVPAIQNTAINASLALTGKAQDPKTIMLMQRRALLQRDTPYWSSTIPKVIGLATSAITLAGNTDFNKLYLGWLSWYPKDKLTKKLSLNKKASFWLPLSYQPSFDFNQVVNSDSVTKIFSLNPLLSGNSYTKNFGTSIVAAAPKLTHNTTTLGGLYDSAVNKFLNKLTLHGVAKLGLKGLVAGSLAGMFTDTIGTVMGLPDSARNSITKSVSLGSALYSILT